MKSANDKGPRRFIAQEAIDVRELADRLGVDEDRMRKFCLEHEEEIAAAVGRSALDVVEELGHLDGLVPLTSDQEPGERDWDEDPDHCTCDLFGCSGAHAPRP